MALDGHVGRLLASRSYFRTVRPYSANNININAVIIPPQTMKFTYTFYLRVETSKVSGRTQRQGTGTTQVDAERCRTGEELKARASEGSARVQSSESLFEPKDGTNRPR
eukprot:scaffold128155_cov60-Phaeocystis_antarctica.AAC.3